MCRCVFSGSCDSCHGDSLEHQDTLVCAPLETNRPIRLQNSPARDLQYLTNHPHTMWPRSDSGYKGQRSEVKGVWPTEMSRVSRHGRGQRSTVLDLKLSHKRPQITSHHTHTVQPTHTLNQVYTVRVSYHIREQCTVGTV